MSGATTAVMFVDGITLGIFLGDDEPFGLEVLTDIVAWRYEFADEEVWEEEKNWPCNKGPRLDTAE